MNSVGVTHNNATPVVSKLGGSDELWMAKKKRKEKPSLRPIYEKGKKITSRKRKEKKTLLLTYHHTPLINFILIFYFICFVMLLYLKKIM